MNSTELKNKLSRSNISQKSYSLKGGLPLEKYCLDNNNSKWYVYYSERGKKTNLKEFHSENDACKYFYEVITKDPTTLN